MVEYSSNGAQKSKSRTEQLAEARDRAARMKIDPLKVQQERQDLWDRLNTAYPRNRGAVMSLMERVMVLRVMAGLMLFCG